MSLNRYNAKRDTNDLELVKAAEKLGWWMVPLDTPVDYLGFHARFGWCPIEIKTSKGTFTRAQVKFLEEAHYRTARVLIWRTLHDIAEFTAPRESVA